MRQKMRPEKINMYIELADRIYTNRLFDGDLEERHAIAVQQADLLAELNYDEMLFVSKNVDEYEVAAFKAATIFGGQAIFASDVRAYYVMLLELEICIKEGAEPDQIESIMCDMDAVWYTTSDDNRSAMVNLLNRSKALRSIISSSFSPRPIVRLD